MRHRIDQSRPGAEGARIFVETWPTLSEDGQAGWISVVYFSLGLALGALSLHVHHDAVLRRGANRLFALALGPVVTGAFSWTNAKFQIVYRTSVRPRYHFWWGLFLMLGFCIVRFGFCHRAML